MKLLEKKQYWYAVSFVTGLSSLGLEICASRLLAPHFGTSTVVWSSVIGIVLLALSIGYYVGGKLAEKNPNEHIPLRILLIGGLFTLCIPLLGRGLLGSFSLEEAGQNITYYISIGSLVATLMLFAPPVFLLGCISPYILTLLTTRFGHLANTAGRLFAISTIGSLLGAFLPTLFFIPLFGTTRTILLMGLALVIAGLPGLATTKQIATITGIVLVLVLASDRLPRSAQKVLASTESVYQHITVTEAESGVRYMQFDAGFGVQSVYMPGKILTGLYYYDYANLIPALSNTVAGPKKILILGLAGGTIPRQLHAFYGDTIEMTAVEIDPAATMLALEYMHLGETPITIQYQDARTFLKHSTETYDFIYVDTYQNELHIPWVNTTKEFWQEVKNRLTPEGVVGINIAALGATDNALVRAITNTQAAVFEYVYDAALEQRRNASHLLVASNTELDFRRWHSLTTAHPELQPLALYLQNTLERFVHTRTERTLTDDHAPLEWIMATDLLN